MSNDSFERRHGVAVDFGAVTGGAGTEPTQHPSPGWGGFPWQRRAGWEGRHPLALIPQRGLAASGTDGAPQRSPHPAAPSPERGAPSAPRLRGTGPAGAPGAAVAARALTDGGGLRPPRLRLERRGGPVPTATARVRHLRVVGKARGTFSGRFGRRKAREAAKARLLQGPSPAGTAYLRALGAYGTAPTLLGDAAAATAPPCCTAQGPTPARTLRGGRAAPERRAPGPAGIPRRSRLRAAPRPQPSRGGRRRARALVNHTHRHRIVRV